MRNMKLNRRGNAKLIIIGAIALVAIAALIYFLMGGGGGGEGQKVASSVIPSNVAAYGAVDGKGLRDSALYKSFQTEIDAAMAAGPVKEAMEKSGLKPDSFDSLVFGVESYDQSGPPKAVMALSGSFDGAKVIAAIKEEAGEGSVEKDLEGKKFHSDPSGEMGVVDMGNGMLLFGSEGMVGQALKVSAGGADSVAKNEGLKAVAGAIDTGATMFMAGAMPKEAAAVGDAPFLPGGLGEVAKATHFGVSVDLSSGITLKSSMAMASEDGAKAFAEGLPAAISMAKGGLGMAMAGGGDNPMAALKGDLEAVLDSVKAQANGKIAVVSMTVSQDTVDKIIKMAKDGALQDFM